jgi:hypothetical protein
MATKEMETKEKCAHPACHCPPAAGSKYCSPYCEQTRKEADLACNCGHAGCTFTPGEGA